MSGKVVFDDQVGFNPENKLGPYFRFFFDSYGGAAVATLESVHEDSRAAHSRVIEILNSNWASQNEMIEACVAALPKTAVVFEVFDPPAGGGHDGEVQYFAFDFAGVGSRSDDVDVTFPE